MNKIRSIVRSTLAIALFGSVTITAAIGLGGISGCGVVPSNDSVHQMWLRCESLARQRYGQSGWQITILSDCNINTDKDGCCRFSGNIPPAAQTTPGCGGAGCSCSTNSCENGFSCQSGKCLGAANAYCQNHWTCQSSFCQTADLPEGDSPNCRNTNGAACANDNQCATQLGLLCDKAKQVCLAKDGAACTVPQHCQSGSCGPDNKCAPPCMDGAKNGTETDVDCGGGTCNKCANGKGCAAASDCTSGTCTNNKCAAPTCTDGIKNGAETDKDCGGGTCPKCANGQACGGRPENCQSNVCSGNPGMEICVSPP